jgi:hypothetical protein
MPNGSGVLFGCFLCRYFVKSKEYAFAGHCQHYNIDTDMSFICKDMVYRKISSGHMIYRQILAFQRSRLVKYHTQKLKHNYLYRYIQVSDIGYPPPTEKVLVASITEYQNLDEEQKQKIYEKARQKALEQYQNRLKRQ